MKRPQWKDLKPRYEDLNKFYFVMSLAFILGLSQFEPLLKLTIGIVTCASMGAVDPLLIKLRKRDRVAWQQYGYLIEEIRKHD